MSRTLAVAVALALSLAVAPAAFAIPADLNTPTTTPQVTLHRGPPTWPAHPQPLHAPVAFATTAGEGFDWGSAGIGAAAIAGLILISVIALRRRPAAASSNSGVSRTALTSCCARCQPHRVGARNYRAGATDARGSNRVLSRGNPAASYVFNGC